MHINRGPGKLHCGKYRGATIFVSPTDNPREITIQTTFCSKKDAFCRKTGRSFALNEKSITINIRALSDEVGKIEAIVYDDDYHKGWAENFMYLYKYMV